MCKASVLVPIPDFLMNDQVQAAVDNRHPEYARDVDGRGCFVMDACIEPALKALWAAGVRTTSCCCGDGSGHGVISFETTASTMEATNG